MFSFWGYQSNLDYIFKPYKLYNKYLVIFLDRVQEMEEEIKGWCHYLIGVYTYIHKVECKRKTKKSTKVGTLDLSSICKIFGGVVICIGFWGHISFCILLGDWFWQSSKAKPVGELLHYLFNQKKKDLHSASMPSTLFLVFPM